MKEHAQKFPACNLNGARAFHMKRNLFGDFGRPLSVSGCMKESVRTEGFLTENLSRKHRIE